MGVAEQPVLDLRSLASVETPEVVSAALRRFRRRLVVRGLWAALALLVAVLSLISLRSNRDLPERIMGASRISYPTGNPGDGLYDVRGVRFVVLEIADLGGGQLGVHVVGTPDPAGQTVITTVSLPGTPHGAGRYASSDWWFETPKPANGTIPVAVTMGPCADGNGCKGSFVIDLGALGVPTDFWR